MTELKTEHIMAVSRRAQETLKMYGKVCVKQSRVLYLVKFLNLCFQFEFHKDVLFQK